MKKLLIFLLLTCGSAAAQDYFPFNSIKGNWTYLTRTFNSTPVGYQTYTTYHGQLTKDTIINGITYYHYGFGPESYYFRNDYEDRKLYIYMPYYNQEFLAIDFNLGHGEKFESYIDGKKSEFKIDLSPGQPLTFYWGKYRHYLRIYADTSSYGLLEGIGFISREHRNKAYNDVTRIHINGAILDSSAFNPITAEISSVTLRYTYNTTDFPVTARVIAQFTYPYFHDLFYVEAIIRRGDSVVFTGSYDVNPDDLNFTININPSMLKHGDKMLTRVIYKDKSIFNNVDICPGIGYFVAHISAPVTQVEDEQGQPRSFEISAPYPNPFNSSSAVKFYLPLDGRVNLTLYDLLGSKVKTLKDEELSKGEHTVHIDAGGLTSGVYLLRFNSAAEVRTYKIVHLK